MAFTPTCLQMNHILVFIILISDDIKSTVGDGYNQFSGMFSAPNGGLQVFTLTIYTGNHGDTGFYIYVNYDVLEGTFAETDNNQNDFESDSGSMVVSLNAYNVNTRSSMACNTYIISDMKRRTSFPGWRLN